MFSFPVPTQSAPRHRIFFVGALLLAVLPLGVVLCTQLMRLSGGVESRDDPGEQLWDRSSPSGGAFSDVPFQITYHRPKLGSEDLELVEEAVSRLRLRHNPGLSLLLHAAAIEGLDMPLPEYPGSAEHSLRDLLLSPASTHQEYFKGAPVYEVTRSGLRSCRQIASRHEWQTGRAAHAGQLLREFARHNISLEHPIEMPNENFLVQDLVRDMVANFSLQDSELEWNSIALMLYRPDCRSWTDKFGRQITISHLAEELIERSQSGGRQACFGTHYIEALAILQQVHTATGILESETAAAVLSHLASCTRQAITDQAGDGSWSPTPESTAGPDSIHQRVHLTGHHVDWMMLLPPEQMPPGRVFQRAAEFLISSVLSATGDDIITHYCPYSHAAHSLQLMAAIKEK